MSGLPYVKKSFSFYSYKKTWQTYIQNIAFPNPTFKVFQSFGFSPFMLSSFRLHINYFYNFMFISYHVTLFVHSLEIYIYIYIQTHISTNINMYLYIPTYIHQHSYIYTFIQATYKHPYAYIHSNTIHKYMTICKYCIIIHSESNIVVC